MAKPPTSTSINCPGCGTAVEIPMKLSAAGREATVVLDTSAIRAHVAEHDDAEAPEDVATALGFIVSDTARWPALRDNPVRYQQVRDWLVANGISPSDIPAQSTVSIEPGLGDGEFIQCTVYVRGEGGHILVGPDGSSPVTERRVVPMLVPLPWRAVGGGR